MLPYLIVTLNCRSNKSVTLDDMQSVTLYDMKFVTLDDMKSVTLDDMKSVTLDDMQSVTLYDMKSVTLDDMKSVTLDDMKSVTLDDMQSVTLYDMKSVTLDDMKSVTLYDMTLVMSYQLVMSYPFTLTVSDVLPASDVLPLYLNKFNSQSLSTSSPVGQPLSPSNFQQSPALPIAPSAAGRFICSYQEQKPSVYSVFSPSEEPNQTFSASDNNVSYRHNQDSVATPLYNQHLSTRLSSYQSPDRCNVSENTPLKTGTTSYNSGFVSGLQHLKFSPERHQKGESSETDPLHPQQSNPKMEHAAVNGFSKKKKEAGEEPDKPTAFVYYLACFATIGGLLFGYDTGIVSGAMLMIGDYYNLNTIWKELIVSGTVGAAAVFALFAGFTCDYLGRKITIMIASIVFVAGAVVMGAAQSKEMLLIGRIVVGAGIGFASMTVPVYIAEAAPSGIRGRLVTLNQLFITIGILISSIVAGGFSTVKPEGWRYMLGLAGVPGIIQFIGFIFLPESPRWLVAKGKDDRARKVLRQIRGKENVDEEMKEILEALEESKKESGFVLTRVLRTPHVLKAMAIGCGLQVFQQLCGINTVIYYSATILRMAGFPADAAIWLVLVPNGINFLSTIAGVALVERLGRKKLLVGSFAGNYFYYAL
ncbi:hypothetical protein Btru_054912 [Bulinus truncatus]|nr:hypothetical protein Btru_054912 [Bulinus truncatus]